MTFGMAVSVCLACDHKTRRIRGACLACGARLLVPLDGEAEPRTPRSSTLADAPPDRLVRVDAPIARALGGSVSEHATILVSGEPGAGKSTECMRLMLALHRLDRSVLILDAEMSASRARDVAVRVGATKLELAALDYQRVDSPAEAFAAIERAKPAAVLVDSLHQLAPLAERAAVLVKLARYGKARLVVVIAQANASGRAHGGHELEHQGDATVVVHRHEIEALKCRWSDVSATKQTR